MFKVVDAAGEKASSGSQKIHRMEVYADEKATATYDTDTRMHEKTLAALKARERHW